MSAHGRRHPGWVPNQHGAWAMLVVPFLLGVFEALRAGVAGWHLVPLFGFWLLGYFTFHAASGWLKAPPKRRPGWVRPLVTYATASGMFGVVTLLLGGWAMLGWVLPYLPLMLPALWLAAQRRERATLGGALTVAAASLMLLVVRFADPREALDVGAAGVSEVWLTTVLVFAYFFGTVLYVKTNIRERGSRAWLVASIAYHGVWAIVTVPMAFAGVVPWWWPVFFVLCTVRAWVVPPRGWTPKHVGFLEIGLTAVLVVCSGVWPAA